MFRFPALMALLCGGAWALGATAQPRPDPLDAHAPVPPVAAASAAPPSPPQDPPALDWRAANERVGRVGGWRSYARETVPEARR